MTVQFNEEGFALETGEVVVYVTDEKGIYTHAITELVVEGTGISAGSYLESVPELRSGYVIKRIENGWEYVEDHRGEIVYSTIDKTEITIDDVGVYPENTTKLKPDCENCEWDGEKWFVSQERKVQILEEKKNSLILFTANKVDEMKSALLAGYPQAEIDSFYKQEKEALAYKADHSADTPLLKIIAQTRGVPFELLVEKVLEKSSQFSHAMGTIIGQRQKFEDRILTTESIEDLTIIENEVKAWRFELQS